MSMNTNSPSDPKIPDLAVFECPGCGNKTVAEKGSTLLCNNCVNAFLARNVGTMQEVPDGPAEIPQPDRAEVIVAQGDFAPPQVAEPAGGHPAVKLEAGPPIGGTYSPGD
jgi:hypothetical protein